MAYIRLDDREYTFLFERIIIFICRIINKIRVEHIDGGIIILVPKNYKKRFIREWHIKRQVDKALRKNNIAYVASEEKNILNESKKYYMLNGKTLMKYLIIEILEYIYVHRENNSKPGNDLMLLDNIFIMVNEYSKENVNIINELAKKFKSTNIVTNNISKYRKLERKMENDGILVTLSCNTSKSLKRAGLIVNIDFNDEAFAKYNVNNNAIIVNLYEQKLNPKNNFNGLVIEDYEIKLLKNMNHYINDIYGKINLKIFLESRILLKKFDIIEEYIEGDKFEIQKIIGKHGIIAINEINKNH